MARASRDSSASLAVGTTLKVRHSPHLINIWQSTTKRSAVDDRDQPANTTVPHAPQTRSSLSFPIGNSKGWRALRSIIDAAGWGMPTLRSLVCVRITAESLRPIPQIEKPRARLQGSRDWPAALCAIFGRLKSEGLAALATSRDYGLRFILARGELLSRDLKIDGSGIARRSHPLPTESRKRARLSSPRWACGCPRPNPVCRCREPLSFQAVLLPGPRYPGPTLSSSSLWKTRY